MPNKPKFPRTRAAVIVLANAIINGLTVDTTDFPEPPVTAAALQAKLDAALAVTNERTTAEADLKQIIEREEDAYDDLEVDMKTDLRYAELVTNGDSGKLKEIGWSGRAAPQSLRPNAPRAFEIVAQGKGFAHFDWKEPAASGGGKTAMYRVMMMETGGSDSSWKEAASSIESEAVVNLQASGKEYIFCAVAVNAAGTSEQSNSVTAFL